MKNVDDDGDVEVFVVCELAHLMFFEYPGHDVRTVEWRRVIIPITMNRARTFGCSRPTSTGEDTRRWSRQTKGSRTRTSTRPD